MELAALAAVVVSVTAVARARARKERRLAGVDATTGVDNALLAVLYRYRSAFGLAARHHFFLDWRFVHVNHGSFGVMPRAVCRARAEAEAGIEAFPDDFFRRHALRRYREVADAVAAYVRAPPGSVALVDNATSGVNSVLRGLALGPGDAFLISDNTYRACANAVHDVASRSGATVIEMAFELPPASAAALTDALAAALDAHPSVRVALVDHITSPTGLVMPVASMVAAAHARGVRVLVDGAHAPLQLDLDVGALGADWYTGNLHKWAFAAKGCALLYTAPAHAAGQQGLAVSHFWKRDYVSRFYMQGTRDYAG